MATKEQSFDVNESLNKSEAFFEKNKKLVSIGICAILIVVAGWYSYQNYVVKPAEEKASTMLANGQEYFANDDFDTALNGDKAGFVGFLEIAKKHSSTKAGNLANLYAGLCYAHKDDAKNAIKYLEAYDRANDQIVSPIALNALGNCYAQDGQIDKAISTMKKAAKAANNTSVSPICLLQAGRLLESQGKNAEAKALYEEIKTEYPQTAVGMEIEKDIERASK